MAGQLSMFEGGISRYLCEEVLTHQGSQWTGCRLAGLHGRLDRLRNRDQMKIRARPGGGGVEVVSPACNPLRVACVWSVENIESNVLEMLFPGFIMPEVLTEFPAAVQGLRNGARRGRGPRARACRAARSDKCAPMCLAPFRNDPRWGGDPEP